LRPHFAKKVWHMLSSAEVRRTRSTSIIRLRPSLGFHNGTFVFWGSQL
jgi:hypothetical protein